MVLRVHSRPSIAAQVRHKGIAGNLILLAALITGFAISPLRAQSVSEKDPLLLTRAGEVHDLPAFQTTSARVHLVGTISYYDPSEQIMFLEDRSGGVYVTTDKTYPVHFGDLVEVFGGVNASYRTEVSVDPVIHFLRRGLLLRPQLYNYRDLATGHADCKLVKVHGKVHAAGIELHGSAPYLHLDLEMTGGEVEVYVKSYDGFDPKSILDEDVSITGVQAGSFDAKSQLTGIVLFVQQSSAIRVESSRRINLSELPTTSIDDVFSTLSVNDQSRRIRVRGTVTYRKSGEAAVLEQDGKSIYVQSREMTHFEVGDEVDAFGFASAGEYAPSLHQALFVGTERRLTVQPKSITYLQALSGEHSDDLVSMTGTLLSEIHDASSGNLVLNFDGHITSAHLDGGLAPFNVLPGSRVRVTGVCRMVAGGPWRTPYLFHLEMRSYSDLVLLSAPSWWTIRHLLMMLSCMLAFALVVAVWAVVLRIKITRQNERIKRSMLLEIERARILEKVSENLPLPLVLSEICTSVTNLLPTTRCSCDLGVAQSAKDSADSLFELPLAKLDGSLAGRIIVSARGELRPDQNASDVYRLVSQLTTMAVQQSRLHQELLYHSNHDALTDLPNRRSCDAQLTSFMEKATQQHLGLALLYLDINRFKFVNDQFGHKVGDLYLSEISRRLQRQIRSSDMLARIGGDEFLAVTLYDAVVDADFAGSLAQRFNHCFDSPFILEGYIIHGSASIGIARYPVDGTSAEELKRAADQNMYMDKESSTLKAKHCEPLFECEAPSAVKQ